MSALFLILAILVALAELGIQLLPSDPGVTAPSQPYNTAEIRVRSILHDGADLPNSFALFRRQNNTEPNPDVSTTTTVPTSTEEETSTTSSSTVTTSTSTSTSSSVLQTTTTSTTEDATTSLRTDITTSTSATTIPTLPQLSTTTTPPDTTITPPDQVSTTTTSTSEILPPTQISTTSSTQSPPSSSSSPSSTAAASQVEPPPPISTSDPLPPIPTTSIPQFPQTSTSENNPPSSTTSEAIPSSSEIPPSPPTASSSVVLPPTSISFPLPPSSTLTPPASTSSTTLQIPTWPNNPSSSISFSTVSSSSTATQVETTASSRSGVVWPTSNVPSSPSTIYTTASSSWHSDPSTTLTTSTSTSLPPSPPPLPPVSISTSSYISANSPTSFISVTHPTSTTRSTASTYSSSIIAIISTSEQLPSSSSTSIGSASSIGSTSSLIHQSTSFSSSHSEFHTEPSPSSTSTQGVVSYTTEQSISYNTSTAEITLPVPFTTFTGIPEPTITTTIVTSVSQSNGSYLESTIVSLIHGVKAPLTDYVTTHTDSLGRPSWTETFLAQPSEQILTRTGADGKPTAETQVVLLYPSKTTLTDYQGRATKTLDYYIAEVTNVLTDAKGHPIATRTSAISETASLTTLFNSNGVPTLTKTELVPMSITSTLYVLPTSKASPNAESSKSLHIVPISDGNYFLGLMLPTFIAILISIPIRIIDRNAKLYQPFHALVSSDQGAEARDSLCLQTADIWSFRARIRSLLKGQMLLTLTGLLLLGSVIMIPLASEAVRIILEGPDCAASKSETLTCKMVLGVYTVPAQIAVALLVFMTVLAGMIALVLRNWKTGLDWNPWCSFRMAQLAANNEIRKLWYERLCDKDVPITNNDANKALKAMSFYLAHWKDNGVLKYSILISNETRLSKKERKSATSKNGKISRRQKYGRTLPFFVLTWTGGLLFLALLCAAEIGLLVYTITGEGKDYTEFMIGRWRIVRFFFTFVGVLISLIWGSFFYAVAFLSPHKLLKREKPKAVYMTPPTNPFSGLRSSFSPNHRDLYLGVVSATAILSEILPLLLSVALDKCTESFWAHTVCLWMAVSLLTMMILTVAGSFFLSWPPMPIDPSTIAGAMHYALVNFIPKSPSSGLLFGRASPDSV
ncbi:hypothetical protein GGR53DRAFT_132592 [Hypoxylon sp. FL1150]|nr:hypothetical protein GGR53DRAFT_132592 [Hypoxylon sp. FL1150]